MRAFRDMIFPDQRACGDMTMQKGRQVLKREWIMAADDCVAPFNTLGRVEREYAKMRVKKSVLN
jgi:hypothetical protein